MMKSFGSISFKRKTLVALLIPMVPLLIPMVPLLILIGSFAVYTIRQQNDRLCENAESASPTIKMPWKPMRRMSPPTFRIFCP